MNRSDEGERVGGGVRVPGISLALLLLGCLAGVSCRQGSARPDDPTNSAPPTSDASRPTSGGPVFRCLELGKLTDCVQADSFLLTRVRCPGPEGRALELSLSQALDAAPARARAELDLLLAALSKKNLATSGSTPQAEAVPAVSQSDAELSPISWTPPRSTESRLGSWSWELSVSTDWIADLFIEALPSHPWPPTPGDDSPRWRATLYLKNDSGMDPMEAPAATADEHDAEISVSELLTFLRTRTLDAILEDMSRPRRPRTEHFVALAELVGTQFAEDPETQASRAALLRGRLREYLLEAPDATAVARALFPRVDHFSDGEFVTAFQDSPRLPLRLLSLAQAADGGDRRALRELLTLAFEFHGASDLFFCALRSLFPASQNRELYAAHPVETERKGTIAFIEAVRSRVDSATWHAESGWSLESPSPADGTIPLR